MECQLADRRDHDRGHGWKETFHAELGILITRLSTDEREMECHLAHERDHVWKWNISTQSWEY
jgi:hypothetical protein